MEDIKLKVYSHLKYFVKVNGLAKYLLAADPLIEPDDLVNDVWVGFFDNEYHLKYDPSHGLSLKNYVFKYFKWYLMVEIRKQIMKSIWSDIDIDYIGDNKHSPEHALIDKEVDSLLEEFDFGGIDNEQYVDGTSQTNIAKENGVSRQAVHARIKRQRKKLRKALKKYL